MNSTTQRLALYVSLAFLAAVTPEIADAKNFSDLTPLQWLKVALAGLGSSLVAWRAYIDQHVAREASKEIEPRKPSTPYGTP
jgi:hypothetical protein